MKRRRLIQAIFSSSPSSSCCLRSFVNDLHKTYEKTSIVVCGLHWAGGVLYPFNNGK